MEIGCHAGEREQSTNWRETYEDHHESTRRTQLSNQCSYAHPPRLPSMRGVDTRPGLITDGGGYPCKVETCYSTSTTCSKPVHVTRPCSCGVGFGLFSPPCTVSRRFQQSRHTCTDVAKGLACVRWRAAELQQTDIDRLLHAGHLATAD